jgi:hypothetical protein
MSASKINVITSLYTRFEKLKEVSGITYIRIPYYILKIVAMPRVKPKGKTRKKHHHPEC